MCGVIIVALNVIIVVVRIFDNIVIDLTMTTPNKIIQSSLSSSSISSLSSC